MSSSKSKIIRGLLENLLLFLNSVKECNVIMKPSKKFRNILQKIDGRHLW